MMPECMICGSAIVADSPDEALRDTLEHFLPESIGGRKGTRGFIHRGCNSTAGHAWDAALAKQLQSLCLMFDIARQKGGATAPLPVVTSAGEHLTLGPGGQLRWTRPLFKEARTDSGQTTYSIKARDRKEARQMLQGLKGKHPQIDVETQLAHAEVQETYAQGIVHHDLGFGGEVSGRSIVKSCLAVAFANGIDWHLCGRAIDYIRETAAEACFGYFQERDLVSGRVSGMPLHCVAVQADPATGLILAYAEYFGIHRIVACLGEGYAGPLVQGCYALDPRDGSEQKVSVELPFTLSDINEIYAYKRFSADVMEGTAKAVIGPAIKQQNETEQRRVLNREVDKAFENCGAKPGEILTEEHVKRIAHSVADGMAPYLAHRMRHIEPLNRKMRRARNSQKNKPRS